MRTSQRRRFGQRRGDEATLAAGVTLMLIAGSVGGVYLVGARSSTHAESPALSSTGPDQNAPAPAIVAPAPQHLSDVTPSERYFNSFLGDDGAGLGSSEAARNIGIRPDMDERRQGYVIFDLSGRFRTLSTTAGVSDSSPAGTRLLLEILGDGRVLMSRQVKKGATVPLTGLDVAGVSELKFVVSNTGPAGPAEAAGPSGSGDEPEGVFADPVLH
jgi:hypothetical protein